MSDSARLTLTLAASAITGVLAAVAMTVIVACFPARLSAEATALFPWMIAAVISTVFATNLVTLAQALNRVRLAAAVSMSQGIVGLALIAGAFITHAITLRFAFMTVVATQALGMLAAIIGFFWDERFSFDGISRELVRNFFFAGLKIHVGSVSAFVYSRLNLLIVFHYGGAEQAGFFATGWVLAFGIWGLLGAFQLALYPRVLHHADDFVITIRSIRVSLYFGMVLSLPVLFLARYLLHVYGGGSFESAAPLFRVLMIAAWVMFLSSLAAPLLIKAGYFVIGSASSLAVGVVSLAANFVLVRAYQADGAAYATLISVVFGFLLTLWLLRYVTGRSPLGVFVPDFREEIASVREILASMGEIRRARREMP